MNYRNLLRKVLRGSLLEEGYQFSKCLLEYSETDYSDEEYDEFVKILNEEANDGETMKPHICELCDKRNRDKCPYPNPLKDDKCPMFYHKTAVQNAGTFKKGSKVIRTFPAESLTVGETYTVRKIEHGFIVHLEGFENATWVKEGFKLA